MNLSKLVIFSFSILGTVVVLDFVAPTIEVSGQGSKCADPANKNLPQCAPAPAPAPTPTPVPVTSFSLNCNTGNAATINVAVDAVNNSQEKISIGLTVPGATAEVMFLNSRFSKGDINRAMASQTGLRAIVSQSDLQDKIGASYLAAGLVDIKFDSVSSIYSLTLAAAGDVFVATCVRK